MDGAGVPVHAGGDGTRERELLSIEKGLSPAALAERLELVSRMLHSRGFAHDLFPSQWMALRYFAGARTDLCTASELARFQGLANGSVSRTVRTLVHKGLLAKAAAQPRGRAEILEVTPAGRSLLAVDPQRDLEALLAGLSDSDRETLGRSLDLMLRRLPTPAVGRG